jgi:hypothetical protein
MVRHLCDIWQCKHESVACSWIVLANQPVCLCPHLFVQHVPVDELSKTLCRAAGGKQKNRGLTS